MIIHIIDSGYMFTVKTENDAPVSIDPHAVKTRLVTFKLMQFKPWQVHIARNTRVIEPQQYQFQAVRVGWLNAGFASGLKKSFQSLVLKRPDHAK